MSYTWRNQDGVEVHVSPDSAVIKCFGVYESFIICDDCREAYLEPAYYSWFDADDLCTVTETDPVTGEEKVVPHECTMNMCPDCAGPYMEPDDEDDKRRPAA